MVMCPLIETPSGGPIPVFKHIQTLWEPVFSNWCPFHFSLVCHLYRVFFCFFPSSCYLTFFWGVISWLNLQISMLAPDIPTSLTSELLRFLLRAISPSKIGLTPAPTSRREVWVTDFGSPPGEATVRISSDFERINCDFSFWKCECYITILGIN